MAYFYNMNFNLDFDKLIYPLIFWTGEGGFSVNNDDDNEKGTAKIRRCIVSLLFRDYFLNQFYLLREEFLCAQYGRLLNMKIQYYLKAEKSYFAREDEIKDPNLLKEYGEKTFIPTFLTNFDFYWKNLQNRCFTLSSILGHPTFFLTITFNPYWPEVVALKRAPTAYGDGSVVSVIFKFKLKSTIKFIKKSNILGKILGYVYRIEYQNRGYLHAHLLFWSKFDTEDLGKIQQVINSHFPPREGLPSELSKYEKIRVLIERYQLHHHSKRCRNKQNECSFGYPKPLSDHSYFNRAELILARNEDERLIVPHNLLLLCLLRSHSCLELISSNQSIGYILKYCSKNSDKQKLWFKPIYEGKEIHPKDKLRYALASQMIPSSQCFASITGAWNYHIKPTIYELTIHLKNKKTLFIRKDEKPEDKVKHLSTLERYFVRPQSDQFDNLTYCEYYAKYSIQSKYTNGAIKDDGSPPFYVVEKSKPILTYIATYYYDTEKNALRDLLNKFPARSFDELLSYQNRIYNSFSEVCYARGIYYSCLTQGEQIIKDAIALHRPPSDLRFLLLLLVKQGCNYKVLFNEFKNYLYDKNDNDTTLDKKMKIAAAKLNVNIGQSIFLNNYSQISPNHDFALLNEQQFEIATDICNLINSGENHLIYLQGSAGTGKTFTVNCIINKLTSNKKCLIGATTGIAATKYLSATTVHSLFNLGIDDEETELKSNFICPIGKNSFKANQFINCDVIIIDEISMLTPLLTEKVSLILMDIMENETPFGGKTILFVGDLLQLPPVYKSPEIPIYDRLITKFDFWNDIKKFCLNKPMRSQNNNWNKFLDKISKNDFDSISWESLSNYGCLITHDKNQAIDFYLQNTKADDEFPLDHLWIASTNKRVNKMNSYFQNLRAKNGAKQLGRIFSTTEIIEPFTKRHLNIPAEY